MWFPVDMIGVSSWVFSEVFSDCEESEVEEHATVAGGGGWFSLGLPRRQGLEPAGPPFESLRLTHWRDRFGMIFSSAISLRTRNSPVRGDYDISFLMFCL